MARSKVKARSHHNVAHLQDSTNVCTIYQLPTPYGCQDIAQTRFSNSRSLRQGQRSNQGHTMKLHIYTPNQYPYQLSTSYTLWFPRYSPDKIFQLNVTTARSKVKSRSRHDVANLDPPTNVPTMNQLPIPYGFCRKITYTGLSTLQYIHYSLSLVRLPMLSYKAIYTEMKIKTY